MLFVPYSSTIETIEWRIPVKIEATTIAVIIPTTMPMIVKAERNLCPTILSNAILITSIGNDVRKSHKSIATETQRKERILAADERRQTQI